MRTEMRKRDFERGELKVFILEHGSNKNYKIEFAD